MIAKFCTNARLLLLLATFLLAGCKTYAPVALKEPEWSPDLEQLASAQINGDQATIHNMRRCFYRSSTDYDAHWFDKPVDLSKIRSVDFVMVPFGEVPGLAHTFLTFGFEGDDYVAISVEVRRRKGETYDPFKGLTPHFPIAYVIADERDVILRRAVYDMDDVYVYRASATPEQARAMFVDMLKRANKLAVQPEFYNTITNNCTTNIVQHVNHISRDKKIPINYEVLFPGYSDRLAYQMGLIASDKPFEATRQAARVNERVYIYREDPNFSRLIRR